MRVILDGCQRLVQPGAHVGLEVAHLLPARLGRHVEIVFIGVFQLLLDQLGAQLLGLIPGAQRLPVAFELVAQPLEEEHAEDVLFVLRGVHVAAQDVAGLEEQAFQAGEGEFVVRHSSTSDKTAHTALRVRGVGR